MVFNPSNTAEHKLGVWVFSAAEVTKEVNHIVENRTRKDYQLIIISQGKGRFWQNNNLHHVAAGQVFLVLPGMAHSYACDPQTYWHAHWVHFDGEWARNLLAFAGFSHERQVLELTDVQPAIRAFNQLWDDCKAQTQSHLLTVRLVDLFAKIGAQVLPASSMLDEATDKRFRSVIRFIHNTYQEVITLDRLAEISGYSPFHFSRLFKQRFDMSPMAYLTHYRIRQAQLLLVQTELSVKEIAAQCGYEAAYFTRIFRKTQGVTPGYFRSMHKP
jgi:AraC-like DNA-binding protein